MYEVEWVDLAGEEPSVVTEIITEEEFDNLCGYEDIGLIHINRYSKLN